MALFILAILFILIILASFMLLMMRTSSVATTSSSTTHVDAKLYRYNEPAIILPDIPDGHPINFQIDCSPAAKQICKLDDPSTWANCRQAPVTCKHFTRDVIYNGVKLERNRLNEGYALASIDNTINCNPYTGDLVLVDNAKSTNLEPKYNFMCACKYPEAIGKTTMYGDCDKVYMCNGQIENINRPMQQMNCKQDVESKLKYIQVRDKNKLPMLKPKPLSAFTSDDWKYSLRSTSSKKRRLMPVSGLHDRAVEVFGSKTNQLIDTCSVSMFGDSTGRTYSAKANGCQSGPHTIPYTVDNDVNKTSNMFKDSTAADGIMPIDYQAVRIGGGYRVDNMYPKLAYHTKGPTHLTTPDASYAGQHIVTVGQSGGATIEANNTGAYTPYCKIPDCKLDNGDYYVSNLEHFGMIFDRLSGHRCFEEGQGCAPIREWIQRSWVTQENVGLYRMNWDMFTVLAPKRQSMLWNNDGKDKTLRQMMWVEQEDADASKL